MKLKFSDGTKIPIINDRIDGKNLLIDVTDKTAEELQDICTISGNTATLSLLNDKGKPYTTLKGYTYCFIQLNQDKTKTIVFAKEADKSAAAIASAQSNALIAKAEADAVRSENVELRSQLQDTEIALTDVEITVIGLQERLGE